MSLKKILLPIVFNPLSNIFYRFCHRVSHWSTACLDRYAPFYEKNGESYPFVRRVSDILLKRHGLLRSYEAQSSIDCDGNPIPWYTYPAVEFLKQIDFSSARVFEYGMGNSSLFWASRAAVVVAVEGDDQWYQRIVNAMPGNVKALLASGEKEYAGAIDAEDDFDLIVVDGYYRKTCVKHALKKLRSGGCIIFDNSDRDRDREAVALLNADPRFIRIDFSGFGPINDYMSSTSIFFDRSFSRSLTYPVPLAPAGYSVQ